MAKPYQPSVALLPEGMRVKAPTVDISGKVFGKLTVVRVVGKSKENSLVWECLCECGVTINRASKSLRHSKGVCSCGCHLRERRKQHLSENTWNMGLTYTTKKPHEEFKTKKAWSSAVKRVRGDACEVCGWKEATCDVHHILPRSKGGKNTVCNGVVLCPNHHRLRHIKEGIR